MFKQAADILATLFGAALVAAGLNLFLVPHHLLSGGISGVSMLLGYFIGWNIGYLYFILNLPILLWGWVEVGKRFIMYSIVSVLATTWLLQMIQVKPINQDPILGAVFGGVLIGMGTGITLRVGGSTGGIDIIGSIITRKRNFPLGMVLFALNSLVVLALGQLFNWDLALYSMLAIFITGKVVDSIHVRHVKMTAFIVTSEKEKMIERLLSRPRGITMIKTSGAYSLQENDMLMTVTTRYELAELRKLIREADPNAFVNIIETTEVLGQFR